MKMSPVFFAVYAVMLSVVVCEATSYSAAFGKPKGSAYRGGANIADSNHSSLNQCHVDNSFFRELIDKARTVQQTAYKNAWSGTQKDLNDVVANAKKQYGFEDITHLGRNATMAVPASLTSMVLELNNGNPNGWKVEGLAYFHQPGTTTIFGPNIKFTNSAGDEVVYNRDTKRIVPNQYMGTKNFAQDYLNNKIDHSLFDIVPHFEDSNYKYVGILYERDVQDPDKFYIIDGQTGLPMTPRQVAEFPTTLSDMWKDMGLSCAKSDSEDVKSKNAPLKAIADGMSQGWEMGGPIGAIGGAIGGGAVAGHIVSIENKRKSGMEAENQQVQTNQTEPVQKLPDGEIDTSNLEDLLKEQIVFVKALLAKGERATDGEIATYNARAGKVLEELKRIVNQINSLSVSEEEKTRIAQEKVVKVKELSEQLAKLVDEVLKKKLIDHLAPTPFANSAETSAPGSHNGGNDDTAGVRGWCHCKHSDKHVVGTPPVAPYTYSICLTCGKVEKAEEGYKGLMVIDNRYYKGADRGKADAEQAKLFEIPDGQVVIPGKCACPKPDPITAGPTRVCITCGLACIP